MRTPGVQVGSTEVSDGSPTMQSVPAIPLIPLKVYSGMMKFIGSRHGLPTLQKLLLNLPSITSSVIKCTYGWGFPILLRLFRRLTGLPVCCGMMEERMHLTGAQWHEMQHLPLILPILYRLMAPLNGIICQLMTPQLEILSP